MQVPLHRSPKCFSSLLDASVCVQVFHVHCLIISYVGYLKDSTSYSQEDVMYYHNKNLCLVFCEDINTSGGLIFVF